MSTFRDQFRESLLLRSLAGAVLAVVIGGGFGLYVTAGPIREAIAERAAKRVAGYARHRVFPVLSDPEKPGAFDRVVRAAQRELAVWRIRLWNAEGKMIYPEVRDPSGGPPAAFKKALEQREIATRRVPGSSDGTKPTFLDVYVPVEQPGVAAAVGELRLAYGPYEALLAHIRAMLFLAVALAAAAGVLGVTALQVRVWRQLRSERDRAAYLATHDPATGLFNQRRFEEDLEQELARAMRDGRGGTVFLFQIDRYEAFREQLGNRGADQLLAQFADMLSRQIRTTDAVARLEGPRFAIAASGVRRGAEEETITNRIFERASDTFRVGGQEIRITVSGGSARYPEDATDCRNLLSCAETALYTATDKGGGCLVAYASVGEEGALSRTSRLREALAEDRLRLEGQPIVDLESNRVTEYELLLRMVASDGTSVSMGPYLEAAEEAGLLPQVDGWVIKAVAGHLRDWPGGDPPRFAINIAPASLDDDAFLELAKTTLADESVDASLLTFEIPEHAVAADPHPALQLIEALEPLGCGFALDDFGAGFSQAEQIEQLPFDRIKIDSRFIRGLPQHPISQHLVKAFAETGQTLGKEMVAQFVEDEATAQMLRRFGMRLAQGYHFGRPRAIESIAGAA